MKIKVHLVGCALLAVSTFTSSAFSLQGPNGNAVDIGEEYRWNVPVITYSFDQSFIDYFGADGVKSVQDAIGILNALPRASRLNVNNYPENTTHFNFDAGGDGLFDLKSITLSTIIRQLGLASPTEHVFDQDFQGPLVYRNFDPVTLAPSFYVNGVLYTNVSGLPFETPVDPLSFAWSAVADQLWASGLYYDGLTRDDVGGLRYLLSKKNINREPKPSLASNKNSLTRRGGVEKIQFIPLQLPRNSFPKVQADFVFRADNNEWNQLVDVQGVHWIPYASANGNPSGAGPGVIRGPAQITFQKLGAQVTSSDSETTIFDNAWGSITADNATRLGASKTNRIRTTTVRLFSWGTSSSTGPSFVDVPVPYGGTVALQISTNNADWTTIATVVNKGGTIAWDHHTSAPNFVYMRAIPADESNSTGGSSSGSVPPTPFPGNWVPEGSGFELTFP